MTTLFDRLETLGAQSLNGETLSPFIAENTCALVLVAGDLKRYREASDAVVIFPDLVKAVGQAVGEPMAAGFVVAEAETDAVRAELGVLAYPSVVVFHHGRFVGAISKMRAWSDYVDDTVALFRKPAAIPS